MSFPGLDKLKDALDDVIHDNKNDTPAGSAKTQAEVRSEIHGEERKEHEIQKKSGWSDRVSPLSRREPPDLDQLEGLIANDLDQGCPRW